VKITNMEIADFFRQLALLTRSGLPLPETLRQLATAAERQDLKDMITACAAAVDDGNRLAAAMEKYREIVPPFYLRMIAIGEREGALPVVLDELAQITRMRYRLATMIKDISFYPVIAISIALLVLLFMGTWIMPDFYRIFVDLLEGSPLPGLTEVTMWFFMGIHDHALSLTVLYLLYLVGMAWLFCNRRAANRLLVALIRLFPFSDVIFYNHAMARLCTMWAAMIRRKVPLEEAFPAMAEIMDSQPLSSALNRVSANCKMGQAMITALEAEPDLSRILAMTVKNTREAELPEQLDRLAEVFLERAAYGFRRAGIAAEILSVSGMVLLVGGIILLLFMPFLSQLFRQL